MKILCISGKAQHGKDTVGQIFKEELEKTNNRVLLIHYGDYVKYICSTYFGWNGLKDEEGRQLLQTVGTDIIRSKEQNFWVDSVFHVLSFFPDKWDYVIIPDCRFPNEVEGPKKHFEDCVHIRVQRPNWTGGLTEQQLQHVSETALDNYPATFTLINDSGIDSLRNSINEILLTM